MGLFPYFHLDETFIPPPFFFNKVGLFLTVNAGNNSQYPMCHLQYNLS